MSSRAPVSSGSAATTSGATTRTSGSPATGSASARANAGSTATGSNAATPGRGSKATGSSDLELPLEQRHVDLDDIRAAIRVVAEVHVGQLQLELVRAEAEVDLA